MKKKVIIFFILILVVIASTFGVAACSCSSETDLEKYSRLVKATLDTNYIDYTFKASRQYVGNETREEEYYESLLIKRDDIDSCFEYDMSIKSGENLSNISSAEVWFVNGTQYEKTDNNYVKMNGISMGSINSYTDSYYNKIKLNSDYIAPDSLTVVPNMSTGTFNAAFSLSAQRKIISGIEGADFSQNLVSFSCIVRILDNHGNSFGYKHLSSNKLEYTIAYTYDNTSTGERVICEISIDTNQFDSPEYIDWWVVDSEDSIYDNTFKWYENHFIGKYFSPRVVNFYYYTIPFGNERIFVELNKVNGNFTMTMTEQRQPLLSDWKNGDVYSIKQNSVLQKKDGDTGEITTETVADDYIETNILPYIGVVSDLYTKDNIKSYSGSEGSEGVTSVTEFSNLEKFDTIKNVFGFTETLTSATITYVSLPGDEEISLLCRIKLNNRTYTIEIERWYSE